MRVLLALPDAPYPPRSGGHWRDWQVVNLLVRAGHELHVLMFATAETSVEALSAGRLRALASSVVIGGRRAEDPDVTALRRVRRKLSYVFARNPGTHPQAYQYDAIGATAQIVEHAARVRADAVVMRSFWCGAAPALKAQGHIVVADSPDYNSALLREMVALTPGVRKIGPWANHRAARRLEQRFLPTCDEIWVPTGEEADAMRRDLPLRRVLVLPNLYDVESVPNLSDCPGRTGSMLFVANYGYAPNARAAAVLLDHVLPEVRRHIPDAAVTFVGAGMSDELAARARGAHCIVAGRVDSVAPYYATHALVLAPVAEGGGMMVKVIEALAHGRCVAGFVHAMRGLAPGDQQVFVAATTACELASQAVALLRDPDRRRALSRNARSFAARELSWKAGEKRLRASLLGVEQSFEPVLAGRRQW